MRCQPELVEGGVTKENSFCSEPAFDKLRLTEYFFQIGHAFIFFAIISIRGDLFTS
jgi:hypothetical protein